MNWEYIEEHWSLFQETAAKSWTKLTEEELTKIHGNRALLVKALKKRYGYLAAFAEDEVDCFYSRCARLTDGTLSIFPSGNLIAPPNPTDEYISS